jgi:UDP-N-acetylglucosamine--N-acetylmuramyl-(pentapeptide) pyrophosphoryl-undecaprenol N-acetylglucosamine transferase
VTGLDKGREEVVELNSKSGRPVRMRFIAFTDRMAELMSAADLVVSRAGAGTLAELIRCVTPAVLVPYPRAADDHQRANAEHFEQGGGGIVVAQPRLAHLRAATFELISNDWLLRKFRGNLQRMDHANLLELMLRDLEEISATAHRRLGRGQPSTA